MSAALPPPAGAQAAVSPNKAVVVSTDTPMVRLRIWIPPWNNNSTAEGSRRRSGGVRDFRTPRPARARREVCGDPATVAHIPSLTAGNAVYALTRNFVDTVRQEQRCTAPASRRSKAPSPVPGESWHCACCSPCCPS
ncbi:hypothetical protein GCM10017778_45000 [Streptomyces vinaceus]|nr:hypothetical protein GCM10017778_45000 [Streptomyces vinaceus]